MNSNFGKKRGALITVKYAKLLIAFCLIFFPGLIYAQHTLTICSGETLNFRVTGDASNLTYTWGSPVLAPANSVNATPQVTPQTSVNQTLVNNTANTATVTYTVQRSNATQFTLAVTVHPRPTLTNGTALVNICSGQSFNYTATSNTAGTTITWNRALTSGITPGTNNGTGSVSEALTNSSGVPLTANYIYQLSANGCINTVNIPVQVNVLPTLNSSLTPAAACSQTAFTYVPTSNQDPSLSYTWSRVSTGGILNAGASGTGNVNESLTNTTLSAVPVTYAYVLTNTTTGCVNTQNVVVNINPKPTLSSDISNKEVCSGTSFVYNPTSALGGTSINWSRGSAANISPNSGVGAGNISEVMVNASNVNAETVKYDFTLFNAGCVGVESFNVLVKPTPALSSSTNTIEVCSASPLNYFPTSAQSNITFAWSRAFVAGISNASQTGSGNPNESLTNTTNGTIQAVYAYTLTNSITTCQNVQNIFVNVNPIPNIGPQTIAICNNQAFTLNPGTAPVGTTYTWGNPVIAPVLALTGGAAQSTELPYISQGLTNNTGASATATYLVTPKTAGCVGSPFAVTVTVASGATPTNALTSNQTNLGVCSGQFFNYSPLSNAALPVTFTWRRYTAEGITNSPATGAGNISEILTSTSTVPQNVVYGITVTSGGCDNTTFINVRVDPPTALSSTLSATAICSGNIFSYTPTSLTSSTNTFSWSRAQLPAINNIAASGSGNPNETLVNNTNAPVTVTYVYNLGTSAGCSNTQSVTVVVNPTPILSSTLVPADVCSGATFVYNPTSPTNGSQIFQWTRLPINGISNGNNSGFASVNEILVNTTLNPITVPYTYTTTANGCSNSQVVNVIIKPKPNVSNTTLNICSGGTFNPLITGVPTGTTYSWGAPVSTPAGAVTGGSAATGQATVSQQLSNITTGLGTLYYTATPTTNGCIGTNFSVNVNVTPIPVVSNITLPAICSGSSFTYNPAGVMTGTLYSWGNAVVTPSASISGANAQAARTEISQTLTNLTTASSNVVYTVTPVSNGCPGSTFNVTVPVNPVATISSRTVAVCSGNTFSVIPASVPAGTAYTWAAPSLIPAGSIAGSVAQSTPVTSISQFVTNTTILDARAQYVVLPISGSCVGSNFDIELTVHPQTSLSSTLSPAAICSNTSFVYAPSSNTPSTNAFNWSRAQVAGISNAAASGTNNLNELLINTSNAPVTVTYVYNLSTTAGCTNSQNVTVVVNPTPLLTSVSNAPAICSGANFSYFPTSNVAGTVFNWTRNLQASITNGAASGSNNPLEILVSNAITQVPVVYNYSLSANGCLNQQTVSVPVNPSPNIANQTINTCSNVPATLNIQNVPLNTLYTWNAPTYIPGGTLTGGSAQTTGISSVSQTLVSQTLNNAQASYTVIPVSGSCQGNAFTVLINVQPAPIIGNQTLSNVCSGSPFTYNASNVPTGTTFTWINPLITPLSSLSGGSAQSVAQTSISQILTSTNNVVNTASYVVTPNNNGCIGQDFTLTVIVNPTPVIGTINDTICTGSPTNFNPGPVPINTRYTWPSPVAQPFGAISGSSAQPVATGNILQTLVNTTNSPAVLRYTITPSAGFCTGAPFLYNVHVGSTLSLIGNQSAEICSGSTFNVLPSNAPPGTTYSWTLPTVAPLGSVTGISNTVYQQTSISQTLHNTTFNDGIVVYSVVAKNTGCTSNTFTTSVRVLPLPRAIITGDSVICRYQFDTLTLNFAGSAPWSFTYTDNNGTPRNITGITTNPYKLPVPASLANARELAFTNFRHGACLNTADTSKFLQLINPLPVGTMNTRRGIYLCNNIPDTLFITSPERLLYQWTLNGGFVNGANDDSLVTGLPGRYNAILVNEFGCVDTLAQGIGLIKIEQPILKYMYDTYCINTQMNFTNLTDTNRTGPIVWQWDFGNNNIQSTYNANNIYTVGGNHEIRLTANQLYCPATPTIKDSIVDIQIPIAGVTMPSVSAYKTVPKAIGVRSIPGYRYRWTPSWGINTPNQANVNFNYTTTQQYAVELISPAGCITRDSLLVRVFDDKLVEIMIPKSFSPNGDGINDKLYPYLSGIREFRYFRIFNRFNQLMFESKNHDEGWNGTLNGVLQPMGIYIWIAVGVAEDGSMVQRTGQTLLLR